MLSYGKKRFAILLLSWIHTLGINSVFAASDDSNNLHPQENLEVRVHSRVNAESNFSNVFFLTPLKYRVKNELFYKTPSEPRDKIFAVQLYKHENPLPSSYFSHFIDTHVKPKGLAPINILNSFKITLLPFFDWEALRNNDFYSRNDFAPQTNSITVFQID